jgi:hypothetical protein
MVYRLQRLFDNYQTLSGTLYAYRVETATQNGDLEFLFNF